FPVRLLIHVNFESEAMVRGYLGRRPHLQIRLSDQRSLRFSFRAGSKNPACVRSRVLVAAIALAFSSTLAAGQDSKVAAPRTPWGDPDLQGRWTNTTTTPLERPGDLAGKHVLTAEERAEGDAARARGAERQPRAGDTGSYNQFWGEAGKASAQTSLIVDPPDGKLPALTAQAQKRAGAIEARRRVPPASWEDLNAYD